MEQAQRRVPMYPPECLAFDAATDAKAYEEAIEERCLARLAQRNAELVRP